MVRCGVAGRTERPNAHGPRVGGVALRIVMNARSRTPRLTPSGTLLRGLAARVVGIPFHWPGPFEG